MLCFISLWVFSSHIYMALAPPAGVFNTSRFGKKPVNIYETKHLVLYCISLDFNPSGTASLRSRYVLREPGATRCSPVGGAKVL